MRIDKRIGIALTVGLTAAAVAVSAAPPGPLLRPAAVTATIVPRKSPPAPSPAPSPTGTPILIMSIGDSITYGQDGSTYASYRAELTRLLTLGGVPHTWNVQAVGGTKCFYWAQRIATLLDTYHPGLVLLDCGTNDTPTDNTQADYTTILAAAAARNIPIVASYIGIPDMQTDVNRVRPYIIDWMHGTNVAIRQALTGYPAVPVADFQRIPHNLEWSTDGIHPTTRGEAALAQIFYQAAQPGRGWPTFDQLHVREMCGLNGSWKDDPEPVPDVAYHVCRAE